MTTSDKTKGNHTKQETKKKSKTFIIVLGLLVVAGGWFGITKYIHGKHHEETDDAQVESNISPVIPRIAGYVKEVKVDDNVQVHKGDTLIILDDRDLRVRLDQAEAALTTAKSNLSAARATSAAAHSGITTSKAGVAVAEAQIEAAKINVWRTTQDYNRYANLIKDHSITQQQYEQALAAKETAESQLRVLEQQRDEALQQTGGVTSQSSATAEQIGIASSVIKQREVDVEDAKLNLSYAVITAPSDGLISKVGVQPGQFLQPGQALFSIVLDNEKWVVANFKETQFNKMRVGQRVTVHADAFPNHDFTGTLTSFAPATGSRFALLPPDNSTGNFVKVVQRLPVKIEFDKQDSLIGQLRAGMNVNVDVHIDEIIAKK